MSRIRITLLTALVFALAAVAINSQAQPPPGGQRGGRGQRGGGPGGGPGGPGGPGNNLVALAGNEAVAKELKLTDRQKAKVKQISDDQNKKRGEVFQPLRRQYDVAKAQAAQLAQAEVPQGGQIDPSVDARGSGAGDALAGALNTRGYQPQVYGGRVLGGQVDPAVQQQAAQFQGLQAANAMQAQFWQTMREAMQELQQESEGNLAKVLDKNQVKRLKEIQLQVQGLPAVIREDVAEKLEITEEQHAEIQTILNEANTARRQIRQQNFQFMQSLMPNQPAGGNPPAAGEQPDPNAAADAAATAGGTQGGQAGQPGQPGQPGQGGRGGRGGRGGANGQNRPRVDPEAMRKIMEQPEVKAKMEETRKEREQLREREYAMVYKAMDRRQVSVFKKMLGKPFDVESVMGGGFMRGGPGGRRNGANGNANQTTAAAKADTAKTTPAANADSSAASTTTTKPATTSRRQSLRERRGLGGQQPTPESETPH
jgi:Spy/CpxP family protein refolding chaperone